MGNYWDEEDIFGDTPCVQKNDREDHHTKAGRRAGRGSSSSTIPEKRILTVLLLVLGFLLIRIAMILTDYAKAQRDFDALREAYIAEGDAETEGTDAAAADGEDTDEADTDTSAEGGSRSAEILAQYYPSWIIGHNELLDLNGDYIGWLYLEDADISYPVMHNPSADVSYIHLDYSKETSVSGSIYITEQASADFSDPVTVIYGHNMRDGSMFGKLKTLYRDPDSLQTPYFFIERPDGEVLVYQIFAMAQVDKSSNLYRVPATEDGYDAYLEDVEEQADLYEPDCPGLSEHSPIAVLSTCYGASGTNRRLMVFGVLQNGVTEQ